MDGLEGFLFVGMEAGKLVFYFFFVDQIFYIKVSFSQINGVRTGILLVSADTLTLSRGSFQGCWANKNLE